MAVNPFDIERVRRNWDRAAGSPAVPLPARVAQVRVAKDPYPEVERILERIGALSRAEFSRHERKLTPFLREASALLTRLRANAVADPAADVEIEPATLRSNLLKVLDDLQDLFEVYSGIGLK